MAQRASCISHMPGSKVAVLHEDYLDICRDAPDPHCAALLLKQFEHWHNMRIGAVEQAEIENTIAQEQGKPANRRTDLMIFRNLKQLHSSLMGMCGERAVTVGTQWLLKRGFLQKRTDPANPTNRTGRFLFSVMEVQEAVSHLANLQDATVQNCKMHPCNGAECNRAELQDDSIRETLERESKESPLNPASYSRFEKTQRELAGKYGPDIVEEATRRLTEQRDRGDRIANPVGLLKTICVNLESQGWVPAAVIRSDHPIQAADADEQAAWEIQRLRSRAKYDPIAASIAELKKKRGES